MKNSLRLFVIAALAAVIGFSMVACDNNSGSGDGSGDNNSGSGALGSELVITNQQVYKGNYSETGISYSNYTGSKTFDRSSLYGGTGAITNGKFSCTLPTPDSIYLEMFGAEDIGINEEYFTNVTVSNPQVKNLTINRFETTDRAYLNRRNDTIKVSGNSRSVTEDGVRYIYVDNDVTISGKGKTKTYEDTDDGVPYKETITTKDFNLNLKAGWNAVRGIITGSELYTGTFENPTSVTFTGTMTLSLGDPSSCKWVLKGGDDYSASLSLGRSLTNVPQSKKTALWFERFKR
jgi:hypothetical protein